MKLLKKINGLYEELIQANLDGYYTKEEIIKSSLAKQEKATRAYSINCTGDACTNDEVLFLKVMWKRKPINRFGKLANQIVDYKWIEGTIIKDSYGTEKQQHTFTVLLKNQRGKKILVKGRNLYGVCCFRKPRENRDNDLLDKRRRGNAARNARYERKMQLEHEPFYI